MTWALLIFLVAAAIVAAPFIAEARRKPIDDKAREKAPGRFATLSQGKTHYQWHGPQSGPVAVLVHGLTTPSYVWSEVIPVMTRMGYCVLTYDLYGRGYSDRPEGEQNRGFFLRQLRELLDDQEVGGDLFVMGYSMGGGIATAFAAAEWERVDRLVLIAPTGLAPDVDVNVITTPIIGDWVILTLGGILERRELRATEDRAPHLPDLPERHIAETYTRGYQSAILSSTRHMLTDIMEAEHRLLRDRFTATLAIWGSDDTCIPSQSAGNLADWNRDAHQVTIEGADHAIGVTHPEEIRNAIQTFLKAL